MRKTILAALIALMSFGGNALADSFPSHPITIVVPFSAGGPSDAMARILAERMKTTLGEPILVENVTGAGGSIGVGRAVRSPPDGYTVSFGHRGTQATNPIGTARAGTIRAYAVTASKRVESAPDVPSTDEAGLPGFHMPLWSGLWVPKDTPKDIVAKLNAAAVDALNDPAVRKQLENLGLQMPPKDQLSPEALGSWQKAEIAKWWPMIKAANVKVD